MKIAVLYGGVSGERDVSLSSGKGIIEALKNNHHDVVEIDFNPQELQGIIDLNVDLVFIGLHGKYGEDGRIQGLLDMLGIPYVGSGVLASALAMDKEKAKQIFKNHQIPVAKSQAFQITNHMNETKMIEALKSLFTLPFVIKPNCEGSTLGLSIIHDYSEIKDAIHKAAISDEVILVEDFIE